MELYIEQLFKKASERLELIFYKSHMSALRKELRLCPCFGATTPRLSMHKVVIGSTNFKFVSFPNHRLVKPKGKNARKIQIINQKTKQDLVRPRFHEAHYDGLSLMALSNVN